jgi:hypothetical protein
MREQPVVFIGAHVRGRRVKVMQHEVREQG